MSWVTFVGSTVNIFTALLSIKARCTLKDEFLNFIEIKIRVYSQFD